MLSALCAVHCLLPVLMPWMALAGFGALVFSPDYEPWLKLGAIALGVTVLTAGFLRHRRAQPALFGLLGLAAMLLASKVPHALEPLMVGTAATLLCLAHYRNWRHLNAGPRKR
nr:MerC domain-containing protein [Oceanococcus sp. HetDA_MAG_MS8]